MINGTVTITIKFNGVPDEDIDMDELVLNFEKLRDDGEVEVSGFESERKHGSISVEVEDSTTHEDEDEDDGWDDEDEEEDEGDEDE